MFKNLYVKNVLLALAVMAGGFVLLIVAFGFYGLLGNAPLLFLPNDFPMTHSWFTPLTMGLISLIVLGISWYVMRSRMQPIYKAMFLAVPTAVVIMMTSLPFYMWYPAPIIVGSLVTASALYFLYQKKHPWLYYVSVLFVSIALLIITVLGVDV